MHGSVTDTHVTCLIIPEASNCRKASSCTTPAAHNVSHITNPTDTTGTAWLSCGKKCGSDTIRKHSQETGNAKVRNHAACRTNLSAQPLKPAQTASRLRTAPHRTAPTILHTTRYGDSQPARLFRVCTAAQHQHNRNTAGCRHQLQAASWSLYWISESRNQINFWCQSRPGAVMGPQGA